MRLNQVYPNTKILHSKNLQQMFSLSLSFSTIQRKKLLTFSYLMKSLKTSTIPVLPIGVFRHFWAVAYVCIGASPNSKKLFLSITYYMTTYSLCQLFVSLFLFIFYNKGLGQNYISTLFCTLTSIHFLFVSFYVII